MQRFTNVRLAQVAVAFPRVMRNTACRSSSAASATSTGLSSLRSLSLASPLAAGATARSFATSPVFLIGAFQRCRLHAERGFASPRFGSSQARRRHGPELLTERRLHGTVTGFKHRRGYGFVLAEGIVPASHPIKKPAYTTLSELQKQQQQQQQQQGAQGAGAEVAADEEAEALLRQTYFFTRNALGGGFYLMEGERVSFHVARADPQDGTKRHLGAPAFASAATTAGAHAAATDADLGEEFSLEPAKAEATSRDELDGERASSSGSHSSGDHQFRTLAVQLRLYDQRTHAESPVTPITLYGKIVAWDDATGQGMVAELDTERIYHEDAPRFPLSIEDVDLNPGSTIAVGRYVRFCLGPASNNKLSDALGHNGSSSSSTGGSGLHQSPDAGVHRSTATEEEDDETLAAAAGATGGEVGDHLVAQRVVLDYNLERRRGAFGRPLVPATAEPGTVSDQTRFTGLVREIRNNRFGFILDDFSGESIFFHASNASAAVREGDRVTYLLREMTVGKHAGKKACVDVQRAAAAAAAAAGGAARRHSGNNSGRGSHAASPASQGAGHLVEEEDDSYDDELSLFDGTDIANDEDIGNASAAVAPPKSASKRKKAAATKARHAEEQDFTSFNL